MVLGRDLLARLYCCHGVDCSVVSHRPFPLVGAFRLRGFPEVGAFPTGGFSPSRLP